jgi:hypothetical protein
MWCIEAWQKRGERVALEIELPRLKVGTVRRLFGVGPKDSPQLQLRIVGYTPRSALSRRLPCAAGPSRIP